MTTQYKTIFLKDLDKHVNWKVKEQYDESALEPYCVRSGLSIPQCKDDKCKDIGGIHMTKSRVGKVQKAVIFKETDNFPAL